MKLVFSLLSIISLLSFLGSTSSNAQVSVSTFGKARDIAALVAKISAQELDHTCTVDNKEIKCHKPGGGTETSYLGATSYFSPYSSDIFCTVQVTGIKCINDRGYLDGFEALKNKEIRKVVSHSSDYLCILTEDGVECYYRAMGWNKEDTQIVKTLKNPTDIFSTSFRLSPSLYLSDVVCAKDDDGVKCWRASGSRGAKLDALLEKTNKVQQIVSLNTTTQINDTASFCILENNSVSCLSPSYIRSAAIPVPVPITNLIKPEYIFSNGGSTLYALDSEGLKRSSEPGRILITRDQIGHPKDHYFSELGICFRDEVGLRCFDLKTSNRKRIEFLESNFSGIKDFREQSQVDWRSPNTGQGHLATCILHDKGESCKFCSKDVPNGSYQCGDQVKQIADNFVFDILSTLGPLLKASSLSRVHLIYDVIEYGSLHNTHVFSKTSYLMHKLLLPVVASMDSKIATEKLIPEFNRILKRIENSKGITGIHQIESTKDTRSLALIVLTTSIESAFDFVSIQDQASLQDLVRALGQAKMDPMNDSVLKSLEAEFIIQKPILDKLNQSSRTRFLNETMDQAREWLTSKVTKTP
jgi:hypothetical protein